MKTRETIPGRTYSVHTTAGCTVSDDSGWSKTLDAPEGYFTAHSGKVYIDDDAATVTELFKLAPQQKLSLLGVLGGDKLPYGYTPLDYLESTGTQYIDTGFIPGGADAEVEADLEPTSAVLEQSYFLFTNGPTNDSNAELSRAFAFQMGGASGQLRFVVMNNTYGVYDGLTPTVGTRYKILYKFNRQRNNLPVMTINGVTKTLRAHSGLNAYMGEITDPVTLFDRKDFATGGKYKGYFASLKYDGEYVFSYIPALDPTGAPCMFDLVSRKPFYNLGTGDFIAGVKTQVQLNNLLYKLPDRTEQEVGTLQVRLADELQTEENLAALDAMIAKNWEISQAA